MRPQVRPKNGNLIPSSRSTAALTLHQGGLSRPLTPAQLLDAGARELAASCKRNAVANSTAYPCRAVADMAVGLRYPLRIIARIIIAVLKGGGPVEFGERIGHLIIIFTAQAAAEMGRTPSGDDPRAGMGRAA